MPEKLVDAFIAGNWIAGLVILLGTFLWKMPAIIRFFEDRSSKREKFIIDALQTEYVKDASRSVLEEEINYLMFKKVTGILANRLLREKIQELVERSGGELQFYQFARAQKFLKVKNAVLHVEVGRGAFIEYVANWLFAAYVLVVAFLMLVITSIPRQLSLAQAGIVVAAFVSLIAFSLFIVRQTLPYAVAKRIQGTVARLQEQD